MKKKVVGCLCIHGFTGGPYEVQPLADYLKDHTDWKVEVITLPGHGETLNLKNSNYLNWIATAEEAMKELDRQCDKVYLVGFSMGGMIASYLAAKYEKSGKLVLLSASGKYLNPKQMVREWAELAASGLRGEWSDNFLFQQYKRKLRPGVVPFKSLVEFKKCVNFTTPYLYKVRCPVLIAQGMEDSMVPYKTAYYLEKEIPTETEVILFGNSKHLICLGDDQEFLNQSVFSFLTDSQKTKGTE